jgi:hypothetical protein
VTDSIPAEAITAAANVLSHYEGGHTQLDRDIAYDVLRAAAPHMAGAAGAVQPPSPAKRPRKILGSAFARALADAGVIHDDLDSIARIVIVIQGGDPVRIFTEHWGDERLIDLAELLPVMPVADPPGPIAGTTP